MATQTKNDTFIPDLEAAGERVRQASDRYLEVGRKVTNAYLDGLERYVTGVTDFERKLAKDAQIDAVTSVLNAHAQMTDELTKAGVSAARELISNN
jgi:hypothetical protein